jgi:hypothetical protein
VRVSRNLTSAGREFYWSDTINSSIEPERKKSASPQCSNGGGAFPWRLAAGGGRTDDGGVGGHSRGLSFNSRRSRLTARGLLLDARRRRLIRNGGEAKDGGERRERKKVSWLSKCARALLSDGGFFARRPLLPLLLPSVRVSLSYKSGVSHAFNFAPGQTYAGLPNSARSASVRSHQA